MCKYCEPNKDNSFVILNETFEYSGIEFALHSKGMLRCRYYEGKENFESQDIVNIKFCPICGTELR